MRTKSPAEFVTTAERMAFAPSVTPTRDGVPPSNSNGMSHTVWERSLSPTMALMRGTGLRAVDVDAGRRTTKALVAVSGDHTTAVASVATEVSNLIIFQRRRALYNYGVNRDAWMEERYDGAGGGNE